MVIKKIQLGWIVTGDFATSKKFFTQILDMKLTTDAPEFGWMELQGNEGGMYLGVGQYQPNNAHCPDKPGSNVVLTMTVDDIVKSKKELEAKGVKFVDDIVEVPGHIKMVSFVDPDGNKFQLVQELQ